MSLHYWQQESVGKVNLTAPPNRWLVKNEDHLRNLKRMWERKTYLSLENWNFCIKWFKFLFVAQRECLVMLVSIKSHLPYVQNEYLVCLSLCHKTILYLRRYWLCSATLFIVLEDKIFNKWESKFLFEYHKSCTIQSSLFQCFYVTLLSSWIGQDTKFWS